MAMFELTSAEFRELHDKIGWTGAKLGRHLGLSPDTISRYRYQDAPIRGPTVLAVRALASGWRP